MRKSTMFLLSVMVLLTVNVIAQSTSQIVVPDFDDKYSSYVKQLEEGQTDIDYQDFRFSFLDSKQYDVALEKSTVFRSLKREMGIQIEDGNYSDVIKITKQMLSIDYTSMLAHKILRQTLKYMGDTVSAAKYKKIELGLLNSIFNSGDGLSCATAWRVIQIEEEYFILYIMGAEFKMQSLISDHGTCDQMDVTINGDDKTYFFEVSKLFEKYNFNE